MKKNLQKMYDSKTLGVFLVVLLLFFGSNSVNAQFSATWPFTSGLGSTVTGADLGNVTASAATYTVGASNGLFATAATTTTGFLNGTGISGRAASSCSSTYNAVSTYAPYLEYVIAPNAGYSMKTDSFTFTVEQVSTVSNVVVAAGYSVNGGSSFTGLAAPTSTGATTPLLNASPTGSNFGITTGATAGTFTFTVPAATIAATNSFILRVVIWRNNASNSSSANLKISPPTITGTTPISVSPVITTPSPSTLSNFNYVSGAGPSASQSFTVSGTNLTADLVVTPATGFEISADNVDFTLPVSFTPDGSGVVTTKTIHTRLIAGQASGPYLNRFMSITSVGAPSQSVVCNGSITQNYYYKGSGSLADVLSWGVATDGTGANPLNFTTAYQLFNVVNTTAVSTDALWTMNGSGSKIIVGSPSLPAVTLTIAAAGNIVGGPIDLPVASSGSNTLAVANPSFLLDTYTGTMHASSTLEIQDVVTSTRSLFTNNILVSAGTFTDTPTGGTMGIAGNLTVTGGLCTLGGTSASQITGNVNITGGTLSVNSRTINGNVTVSGTGFLSLNTGNAGRNLTINGNVYVSGTGGIRNSGVTSATPGEIGTVNSFQINLAGIGKTITITATGNNLTKTNLVVIGSYALSGDLDYTSAGATVFGPGQAYFTRQISLPTTGSLSIGAHTLKMGNSILNVAATAFLTDESGSIVETSCAAYQAHAILEAFEPIEQVAILPSKTWLGTVKFNNSGTFGQKIVSGTYNNIFINNTSGTFLGGETTVNGVLTFTAGNIATGASTLTVATSGSIAGAASGTGWVVGNLKKLTASITNPSYTYAIGDATNYTPLALTFSGNTSATGGLTASTAAGDHATFAASFLNGTKSVNRTWTLTNDALADFGTYNATFGYATTDNDAGSVPSKYAVHSYNGAWSALTTSSNPTATTATATGISGFGDLAIFELNTLTFCKGATIATAIASATSTFKFYSAGGTVGTALPTTTVFVPKTLYVSVTTVGGTESVRVATLITVNALPVTPSLLVSNPLTESKNICKYIGSSTPVTFDATAAGAVSYIWAAPGTATIATGGTGSSVGISFLAASTTAGAIGSVIVQSVNSNGCISLPKSLALTTKAPTAPTSLVMTSLDATPHFKGAAVVPATIPVSFTTVGLTSLLKITKVGPYMGTSTVFTLEAQVAPTAASYLWTLNGATQLSGDNGRIITVDFSNVNPGIGALPISVQSVGGCGNSSLRTLTLAKALPTAPTKLVLTNTSQSNLSGVLAISKVGPYTGTNISFTLTATPFTVQGATATSYAWVLPAGVFCTSPSTAGVTPLTGTTVINTVPTPWIITDYITTTTSTITVNFSGATGTGILELKVFGVNGSGNSAARTLKLARALPTAPTKLVLTDDAISASVAVTKVGAYTAKSTSLTLTATPFTTQGAEATSFSWVLPAGVNVTGGVDAALLITPPATVGTTKTWTGTASTLTVNLAGIGTAVVSIPLSVYAVNGAGTSLLARTLTLTSAVPTAPAITAGASTFSSCPGTTTTYTATAIPGATYTWTIPDGASIVGEENENVIVVDFTGATIASAYAIKCIATNGTGPSLQKSLTIKKSTAACRLAPEGVSINDFSVIAYPNPSSGVFTIDIQSSDKGATGVQVYDMTGRLIESRQAKSNSVEVGRNYASGVYNVKVNKGGQVKTLRVIKR